MDISNDHMRRELGELGREHDRAMRGYGDALDRLVNDDDLDADQKDDFVLGGLNRRKFMTIGGVSIASAAIFAACGSSSRATTPNPTTTTPAATTAPTTGGSTATTAPAAGGGTKATASDLTILRTATSLELLAVETYGKAIRSGLVTSAAVAAAAKDFMAQHQDHAAAFTAATKAAGGTPFTEPNPVVYQGVIAPALAKLKDQTGVVELAYTLENAAAQTYVSTVGAFDNASYNSVAASIAGVESRHMTILASVLAMATAYPEYEPTGFFPTTGAVKPGTGVS